MKKSTIKKAISKIQEGIDLIESEVSAIEQKMSEKDPDSQSYANLDDQKSVLVDIAYNLTEQIESLEVLI